MTARPAISVIIPTFQRCSQVIGSVESVLAQVRPPEEIIVVDDGSTDGTAGSLRGRFGHRVIVLEQDNRGPAAARNAAIGRASGDTIAFNDSDNRWRPHHLTMIEGLLRRFPDAVLVATQRKYRFGHESLGDARVGDLAEDLLLDTTGVALLSTVAIRREALVAVGGFDEDMRYGEDTDLYLRLALLGPFAQVCASTVQWHQLPDSLSAQGRRIGSYARSHRTSGEAMLRVLGASDRPDADRLRAAARARIGVGDLFEGLAAGTSARSLRACTAEIAELAPRLVARPAAIAGLLPSVMPGWEHPSRRLRALATLLRAWPARPISGYQQMAAAALVVALRSPSSNHRQ